MLGTRDYMVTRKNNVFSKNECQPLSFRPKNSVLIVAHSMSTSQGGREVGGRQRAADRYSSTHEVQRSVGPQPRAGNNAASQSAVVLPDRLLMLNHTGVRAGQALKVAHLMPSSGSATSYPSDSG